jgi:hypothetical protein
MSSNGLQKCVTQAGEQLTCLRVWRLETPIDRTVTDREGDARHAREFLAIRADVTNVAQLMLAPQTTGVPAQCSTSFTAFYCGRP